MERLDFHTAALGNEVEVARAVVASVVTGADADVEFALTHAANGDGVALGFRARWQVIFGTMAATILANLLGDRNVWGAVLFGLCNAGEARIVSAEIRLDRVGAMLKRLCERLLEGKIGNRLERWEMSRKVAKLSAQVPAADGEFRDRFQHLPHQVPAEGVSPDQRSHQPRGQRRTGGLPRAQGQAHV